jgi:hypothetical protein
MISAQAPSAGNPPEPDRHRSAPHGSGHAVLAYLLGLPVASMALHSDGSLAGHSMYMPYSLDSDPSFLPGSAKPWPA